MVRASHNLLLLILLFILGACASGMKDKMKVYREAYAVGDYEKASGILKKSGIEKNEKDQLLWHLEMGTLALAQADESESIRHFETAVDLIDKLYTKKISAKAASFLINDASDVFYGASYERSYAHYFLSKAYYARYQKLQNKLDLQGARGTILAWDSYFAELQRSAAPKTIYQTDLMLKIFGGEVHEVSEIRNDKQIALQLYKDALKILETMGGSFAIFNANNIEFIKAYQEALAKEKKPSLKKYEPTEAQKELKDFIHYKILALTRDIRGSDYGQQTKSLKPSPEVLKRLAGPSANVVILLEEGLIPQKVGRPFNFGLKGAVNAVDSPAAKAFISTVGSEILTAFAMNTLGMAPGQLANGGNFVFAHSATKLAVQEAAVAFELPMIENSPAVKNLKLFILDDNGKILKESPLPIISENGDIAKIVLEEDVVSRYVKTGTRVAVRHLIAIVAAMQIYNKLKQSSGDFIAKTAAMATYVGASKGIAALEKADTRHWTTLPQVFRMTELNLPAGSYKVALAPQVDKPHESNMKILGNIQVNGSGKAIHTFKLVNPLP